MAKPIAGLTEVCVRHFTDGWAYAEVILSLKAECTGYDITWEGFAFVAIITNVAVVEAPGRLDAVFGVDQFGLEL